MLVNSFHISVHTNQAICWSVSLRKARPQWGSKKRSCFDNVGPEGIWATQSEKSLSTMYRHKHFTFPATNPATHPWNNHQDRIDMPATSAAVNIRTGFNVTAMPNLGYSDMNLQSDVGLGLNKSWRDEANRSSEAFKTLENFEKRCQEGTIQKPFSLPKNNTHFLCPCVPLGLRK